MEEMGQDNSFQVERDGNDPFSTSLAGKARSNGHKLQREGPGRESKKKHEDSKELDKKWSWVAILLGEVFFRAGETNHH